MKIAITTAIILLLVAATATVSYGQGGPPEDVRIIEQDEIRTRIITGMGDLTDYKLYPNGTGEFTFRVGTSGNNTMTVIMDHSYRAELGYIYNSTGIYTRDGSQRLIIATTN